MPPNYPGRIRHGRPTQSYQFFLKEEMGYNLHGMHLYTLIWSVPSLLVLLDQLMNCDLASSAGSYNLGFPSMTRDLNCTDFQATIGLSVYALGFAIVPLVSASFSEEFGRQPLYIGSAALFLLMHIMVALYVYLQSIQKVRILTYSH